MQGLGVIVRGLTVLWIRGPQPTRADAEQLTYLWQKGRRALRKGTQKYEEPFESFCDGLRRLNLVGGQPGKADWAILLQDPPPGLMAALVFGALKLHHNATRLPAARPAFPDREIYSEVFR